MIGHEIEAVSTEDLQKLYDMMFQE